MSESSGWVRLVARRLCGGRSPEEWEAEAARVSELRRQRLVDSADRVLAAREFVSLLEHPTSADLERREQRWAAEQRKWAAEERRRAAGIDDNSSDSDSNKSNSQSVPASEPHPSTLSSSTSLSIPLLTTSPVQHFDALIAADVTVEQVRAHRQVPFDSPRFDPVQDAVRAVLNKHCPELTVLIDRKSTDEEICSAFALFDERLHLAAPMAELQRQAEAEFEAAQAADADGDKAYNDAYWSDCVAHVIGVAVDECRRLGVQVLDYTSGDTYELLLCTAQHFERCQTLLRQLGMLTTQPLMNWSGIGPFGAHDPQHCAVCAVNNNTARQRG